MKIIALLPMKGNSERVPNKNLKSFNGKPLYHAIVNSLLKSKFISKIAINTDSEAIKNDAISNFKDNIIIIDRPESIQGDFVSMNTIINYDIDQLSDYDHFIQTHSTNPLLKSNTIDEAIEYYFKETKDKTNNSVFSVTRFQTRFYYQDGKPLNHNPNILERTQDLPIIYEENSNFYIFSRESFIENEQKRIGSKPLLYEIDKIEAVDIDEPQDFLIAETLYKSLL